MREPAVYIMASPRNGTLYVGVMSNLPRRAHEHRTSALPGFTARYGCKLLVLYQATKMLTHLRRVTPHERRRAAALASGQRF